MQEIHSINQGKGLPLLFQHGLTADVRQVDNLLGGLDEVHLLSIDCPGQGKSQLNDNYTVSFDTYSDEVIRNMDMAGIDMAVFGGISMGSGIALNIGLRYPDRVLGLVLVRPAWIDKGNPANLSILLEAIPFMTQANGVEEFQKLQSFRNLESLLPLSAKSVLGVFAEHQQDGLSSVIENMVADHPFDDLDKLRDIVVPCLVIGNEDDPLHPYSMAEIIKKYLPNSALKKVVSGYKNKVNHRDEIRNLLQEFIKNKIQYNYSL